MVKKWIQENTDIDLLYTMADGIMGKAGYVYQAFNFFYGGKFRTAVYRDTITGEKIHPRTARKLCEENAIFLQKERVHWLTPDYMKTKNLERIDGLMFRYMLPMNKKAKKHFKKSTVDWTLNYPKHKDIEFWKQIELGKYEKMADWPVFTFDNMNLSDGISFVLVVMATFAMSEALMIILRGSKILVKEVTVHRSLALFGSLALFCSPKISFF